VSKVIPAVLHSAQSNDFQSLLETALAISPPPFA
jgi:hypothetical protein